jgi:diguanylate cyclase (GGDEF)-like protein
MDGFKQINDRFGHLEGNRVLRMFAQALKQSQPRVRLRSLHGRR